MQDTKQSNKDLSFRIICSVALILGLAGPFVVLLDHFYVGSAMLLLSFLVLGLGMIWQA